MTLSRLTANDSALSSRVVADSVGHSLPVPVCLECTLNCLVHYYVSGAMTQNISDTVTTQLCRGGSRQ